MMLPRWLPLTLLAVLLLALFHRLLLGEALFWGLPALQFYPWREFAIAELRAGRLPLWNPYNGAGAPLLANYQSAVFYPPRWILHLLPAHWLASGMGILTTLHLFWCGVGMWRLAARLRLNPLGQTVMTLAFPLSTTLVARLGTTPMIDVAAWLPWSILTTDRLIERPSGRRIAALAAVIGMQLLAGHAQWAAYSLALTGAYALYALFASGQRQTARPLIALLAAALAALLGVGLAAAQLAPTAELQRLSQRAEGVDESFALNFSLQLPALLTLFNPDFFGNPGEGTYTNGGAAFEIAAYIGILPLLLALAVGWRYWRGQLGQLGQRGRRDQSSQSSQPNREAANRPPPAVGFFSVVAVVALVLALGQYTPIYPFLYRNVPTFDLFQAPARWLLLTVFSAAVLAGFAASDRQIPRRARRGLRLGIAGALGVAGAAAIVPRTLPDLPWIAMQMAQGAITLGALLAAALLVIMMQPPPAASRARQTRWIALALLFVCADLWWANARSNPTIRADFYAPRRAAADDGRVFWSADYLDAVMFERFLPFADYRVAGQRAEEFREARLPNLNLLDRRPALNNFDPLRPAWHEQFIALLNESASAPDGSTHGPTGGSMRVLLAQIANVTRFEMFETETGRRNGGSAPPQPAPRRVWMVGQSIPVADGAAAAQILRSGAFDPTRQVILEGEAEAPESATPGSATITLDEPQRLAIRVDSPGGGWLVLADTWYPGWQATLDGVSTPLYRANLAFRAVYVPPGEHTVRMDYQPVALWIGLAISGLALFVCGGLALAQRRRKD